MFKNVTKGASAIAEGGKRDKWWQTALWGLALLGAAAYLYWDLTNLETEGGTRRVKWYIAFLYNTLGKWGAVGLVGLGGAVLLYFGIRDFSKSRASNGEPK